MSFLRWLRIVLLVLGTLLLTAVVSIFSCNMIPSDNDLIEKYHFSDAHATLSALDLQGHFIRTLQIRSSNNPKASLYVVHGAPGDLTAFDNYYFDSLLRASFDIVGYDRPGYSPDDLTPMASIETQAQVLAELVHQTSDTATKIVFLSHSYGGPIAAVACNLLSNYEVSHVMVAPVMDPDSEPIFWYSNLPLNAPLNFIASATLTTAASEKMGHREALVDVTSIWAEVASATLHVHGTSDWLAPSANIGYVAEHFNADFLNQEVLKDRSHFILWSEDTFVMIRDSLLRHR